MTDLVFLVEELSMKITLDLLLPRVLPSAVDFQVLPHEGKSDLERSIPRKLRGWAKPKARFMVLRDNDGADCLARKRTLVELCHIAPIRPYRVRMVCQELESWFLGDLEAVGASGLNLSSPINQIQRQAKFRHPDDLNNAKEELQKLVSDYRPTSGARKIAPYLKPERNRSHSFHIFLDGVHSLLAE